MAYNVSNSWEAKVIGEDKKYVTYLTIDDEYIPITKLSRLDFIEDVIDKENEYMYIGTFRSNQLDITFKSLDDLEIASNLPVHCEIGLNTDYQAVNFTYIGTDLDGNKKFTIDDESQLTYFKEHYYVNITINGVKYERIEILDITDDTITLDLYQVSTIETTDTIVIYPFEYVPKGEYLIDELDENYHKTCKVSCLDYGIIFKTPVDYSVAFVDGKISLENLLIWLCNHYGVTLGTYPNINNNIEIGVYDSTLSGKTYVSYIAELFGGNVKIDRTGVLNIIPLKQNASKTINALKTKTFELGENYKISKVIYQDATRIYESGSDTYNTLFIRPENMFVEDQTTIDNVYNEVKDFEIYSLTNEKPADLSIDSWDIVNYQVGEDIYATYYNNSTTYANSLMSKVETKIPTKQQEITTNVVNANVDTKLSIVKTTIDLLNATIQLLSERIVDVSNTITGYGSIQLSNAYKGTLHRLEITGNISLIFPSDDLFPSGDLYPLDSYLLVDNNKYHLDFTILRLISSDICDKYIYEDGKQWIERHVGVDGLGNMYELQEPIIENREDLIIEVDSDSTIHLESFNNANYKCTYLLDNEYTNTFTTNVDLISQINLSPGNVLIEASKLAKITAEKILMEGYISANGNFTIDLQGNMSCNDATINGNLVTSKGVLTNLIYNGYVRSQLITGVGDYLPLGHVGGGSTAQTQINDLIFSFDIPDDFIIDSAAIYLYHCPISWTIGGNNYTGYSRDLKLYKGSSLTSLKINMDVDTGTYYSSGITMTEVPNAFGSSGFTGSNSSATSIISIDLKNFINIDENNYFVIKDSGNTYYSNNNQIFSRTGGVFAYLEIIGYKNLN